MSPSPSRKLLEAAPKFGSVAPLAFFAIVYSALSASIYFSLGVVLDRSAGWILLVFVAAGILLLLAVLTYAEGASLYPEPGGGLVFARYAFNELVSFIAGWAIFLDYLILLAIAAVAATNYAAAFWGELGVGTVEVVAAIVCLVGVGIVNTVGLTAARRKRIAFFSLIDLVLQMLVIVVGLWLVFDPEILAHPITNNLVPFSPDVLYALTIAIVALTGLEAAAGISDEANLGRRQLRSLVGYGTGVSILLYVGIGVVASSVLLADGTQFLSRPGLIKAPMLELVRSYGEGWTTDGLAYVVALVAVILLIVACSSTMLGLSRLGYSLATNRQIPSAFGRLHPRFATPHVLIGLAVVISSVAVATTSFTELIGIYAFGAMLAFTLAHTSICVLRFREPDRPRAFRIPFSIPIGRGSLPVPAAIGAVTSLALLVAVVVVRPSAAYVGLGWMAAGLVFYVAYRKGGGKPLLSRITVPEKALRTEMPEGEFGSILVPIFGSALDDDIVQTAARLLDEEEAVDESAQIAVIWTIEIPLALPLDAELPEERLRAAEMALDRAKAIGEEYHGVRVEGFLRRCRRAGNAIVDEARVRGVEAIIMAVEPPSKIRGGVLLGGRGGPLDNYVGNVTRYVVDKAPCSVILTAPPADDT